MILLLKIAYFSTLFWSLPGSECHKLPNGNYTFIQPATSKDNNNKLTTETRVVIADSNFIQYYSNGDSLKGKIEWMGECLFRLIPHKNSEPTDDLEKLILKSFGERCYELQKNKGRKVHYRTTYTGNLHVTTGEGVIVRNR